MLFFLFPCRTTINIMSKKLIAVTKGQTDRRIRRPIHAKKHILSWCKTVPHAKYTNGTYYGIPYHNQYPIATACDSRRPERNCIHSFHSDESVYYRENSPNGEYLPDAKQQCSAQKQKVYLHFLYFPIHQGTDSFATIITTNIIAMWKKTILKLFNHSHWLRSVKTMLLVSIE